MLNNEKQDFEALDKGIKKYTDFFGYNLELTKTGPDVGLHPYACIHKFHAFQGELWVKLDKDGNQWKIEIKLVDGLGKPQLEKSVESEEPLPRVAKELQDILGKLPRNQMSHDSMQENFADIFVKQNLYLVEKEYNTLF